MIYMYLDKFIVFFLFFMLYGLFFSILLKEIKNGFCNLKFVGISFIINFLWIFLFVWGLGVLFFFDYLVFWVGFIMLMVILCIDWYLIFIEIVKGNVVFFIVILFVNLIL